MANTSDSARSNALTVALIVPDVARRRSLATLLTASKAMLLGELEDYPSGGDLSELARLGCDVVIVDLDGDVEKAIRVIESICSPNLLMTVMAYSSRNDLMLMRRSMQAGAREFLTEPLLQETVHEAFVRASTRRPVKGKVPGKILAFVPSKGGVGVTTIAANFAIALVKESGARVVLVDLDFQLGEIILGLGMTAKFSVVDALTSTARLDRDFLSTLLVRHSSGLAVLASPDQYRCFDSPPGDGADKLFRILRQEFDYVVMDAGTCHGHVQETLFGLSDTIYVVTEMTLPALRNGHRLISFLSASYASRHLELIVNRFNARHGNIDEISAAKALTRPVNWRIPNAYAAVRTAQDNGVPLAMEDSPITRVLGQMAKAACGKPSSDPGKRGKGFSLFGFGGLPHPAEA